MSTPIRVTPVPGAESDWATGGSELVAILFTDLVGSTELANQQGDAAADTLRRDHFSHLREALASTGGAEIKTIGDALMASLAERALELGTAIGMDGPACVVPRAQALLA